MTHLGDDPAEVDGIGEIVGKLYYANFTLPDNFDTDESAVIQCQTMHGRALSNGFFINNKRLDNILNAY